MLQYVDLVNYVYGFVPDEADTTALLKKFTPLELLFAQMKKFAVGQPFSKNTMAHFFKRSAPNLSLRRPASMAPQKSKPERSQYGWLMNVSTASRV